MGDHRMTTESTTVTVEQVQIRGPKVDKNVIKTIPFLVRLGLIVLAIIVLICIGSTRYHFAGDPFIDFTAAMALIICVVFTLLYVFAIPEMVSQVPWTLVEMGIMALWTLFYAISFIIAVVNARKSLGWLGGQQSHDAHAACAFFALVATIGHGALAFLLFRLWSQSRVATDAPQAPRISVP